jgi:hypothetical protein
MSIYKAGLILIESFALLFIANLINHIVEGDKFNHMFILGIIILFKTVANGYNIEEKEGK